jgi:hypothetical protein
LSEYIPTVWVEAPFMTTPEKIDALNNLETMCEKAVEYIDETVTHLERYYSKEECNSRFFTPVNDGTGSGMICEKLDGMTAQQIINAYVPRGIILAWSGTVDNIPSGFAICNGTNGTPDLRDRFIVGAGSVRSQGSIGGSNEVTTTATVTIAGHALTRNEVPLHTHSYVDRYEGGVSYVQLYPSGGTQKWVSAPSDHPTYTEDTGSGAAHIHPGTYEGTPNQAKMPQYYALLFIMRL